MGAHWRHKAIGFPPMSDGQWTELESLYRATKVPRLRALPQIVLLVADQRRKAPETAAVVREGEVTGSVG